MKSEDKLKPEYETTPCINCGNNDFSIEYIGRDRLLEIPGRFDILKCEHCGLFKIHPQLSSKDLSKYYPDNYICFLPAIEEERNWFRYIDRSISLKKKISIIRKHTKETGRILDIGCATGILLNGLQKVGWECYGVEPDKASANYARDRFGLTVFNGIIEDSTYPENYFDAVTMIDVLEHTIDPKLTMDIIKKILRPSGVLIGTLPNSSSLEKKLFGPYWDGWEVPRHNQVFNPTNLRQFLKSFGFSNLKFFSFTGRHGNFMLSLRFFLAEWKAPDFVKKVIFFVMKSLPVRIIMLPGFLILEKINRSTNIAFSAQLLQK